MKNKNAKHVQLTMEYQLKMAYLLPEDLQKRKIKEMLQLANKYQIRVGKIKRIICKKCFSILIPKINSETLLEKRDCGFGITIKCNSCQNNNFLAKNKD